MKRLKLSLFLAVLALPALAYANNTVPDPAFVQFAQTITSWATGSLGTGLAVTMLMMGAAIGVARNSPMPALVGVAGAAFLNFMPGIMMNLAGIPAPAASPAQTSQMLVTTSKAASSTIVAGAPALLAPAALKAVSASSVKVVTTAAAPTGAPQIATVAAPQPPAFKQTSELKALASHASSLSHTVPVPMAAPAHVTLKAPTVSSSQVTRWVGIGGAAIILTLLSLLMYLSAQRRAARTNSGFNPGSSSSVPTPTSVFSDPHGFKREKRSTTFGHESA